MTGEYRTFGPGYDAKLSAALCMDKVQELVDGAARQTIVSDLSITLQAAQLWTALAHVHATCALVYATEGRE